MTEWITELFSSKKLLDIILDLHDYFSNEETEDQKVDKSHKLHMKITNFQVC